MDVWLVKLQFQISRKNLNLHRGSNPAANSNFYLKIFNKRVTENLLCNIKNIARVI